MDLDLEGKTAIVTGGGSNIGRAISLTLGREGANVVIADIDEAQGAKTAGEIVAAGGSAKRVRTDVTDCDSLAAMVHEAIARFGQVHILINNVGWTVASPFLDTDLAFWDKVYKLNYLSDLFALKVVLPHMIEKGYGRIVNIGSDAGRIGKRNDAIYSGMKGAVISTTKAIAREVGRYNITLNCVCPDLTMPRKDEEIGSSSAWKGQFQELRSSDEAQQEKARRFPLRRLGFAQDIANAVVFLASDAANYITGQTLSVSGGGLMM